VTYLLDVNVLIALLDPKHVHNSMVLDWFERQGRESWATCPLSQNGAIRIVSGSKYPNRPASLTVVIDALSDLCRLDGHVFWADDISLLNAENVDARTIASSGQVTDTYLLALAVGRRGRLATLDRRLSPVAVSGGAEALHLIGS
jgi:uncharacterized protein